MVSLSQVREAEASQRRVFAETLIAEAALVYMFKIEVLFKAFARDKARLML